MIDLHVHRAHQREDYSQICHIGIDETACRRGQHYITLVHDLQQRRLICTKEGCDNARWSQKQAEQIYDLIRSNLKTARAWRLKEALRDIFREAGSRQEAEHCLKR